MIDLKKANLLLTEAIARVGGTSVVLEAVGSMDSAEFCKAVERKAKVGGKFLYCDYYNQFNKKNDTVTIKFVNVPSSKIDSVGGANEMNNRFMVFVRGFHPELGKPPPTGKVRISTSDMHNSLVFKEVGLQLRGKTTAPEKMVVYIADHLAKLAKVDPRIR